MLSLDAQAEYVVKVQGRVDPDLVDWFGPLEIATVETEAGVTTTLSRFVTDQAGLMGLVRALHGLGVTLLSVERAPAGVDAARQGDFR